LFVYLIFLFYSPTITIDSSERNYSSLPYSDISFEFLVSDVQLCNRMVFIRCF